jgi:hypothetical protein
MPSRYYVYGLTVESDLLLPELPTLPSLISGLAVPAAIRVQANKMVSQPHAWLTTQTLATGEPWLQKATLSGKHLLRFPRLAEFVVSNDGKQIQYHGDNGTPKETLRHLLLDHVLPLTLSLRGIEALHATAVRTPTGVWAFTGASGVGKSTLAAYLVQSGLQVLCDDCLVFREDHEQLLIVPGYPGVRLWQDALAVLTSLPGTIIPAMHEGQKQRIVFDTTAESFPNTVQPITRIYSLVRQPSSEKQLGDAEPRIEQLSPRDACVELLLQLYRFDSSDRTTIVRQLGFLERLVSHVAVRRLYYPSRLSALPELRRILCEDLD